MTTNLGSNPSHVRTYGGWRRTRGIGLFGVGPMATLAVLCSAVVPLVLAALSLRLFLISVGPAAVVTTVTLARVNGVTLAEAAGRRLAWHWACARGWTSYRATTIDQHPRAWDLPGVLAPTMLVSAPDGRGGEFGLVWNRRSGHLTATLLCTASSTWLVDEADADGWVANWHAWLASLGYLPMVRAVAVTIDTAPEAGTTLRDLLLPRLDPTAPEDVRRLMAELVDRSPAAAADISTRVSVSFDPARCPVRLRDVNAAA